MVIAIYSQFNGFEILSVDNGRWGTAYLLILMLLDDSLRLDFPGAYTVTFTFFPSPSAKSRTNEPAASWPGLSNGNEVVMIPT